MTLHARASTHADPQRAESAALDAAAACPAVAASPVPGLLWDSTPRAHVEPPPGGIGALRRTSARRAPVAPDPQTQRPLTIARAGKGWSALKGHTDAISAQTAQYRPTLGHRIDTGATQDAKGANTFKTTSAFGAQLASQTNNKDAIGSADSYMGAKDAANSKQSKHLQQFLGGGHAFITLDVHKSIHDLQTEPGKYNFGGWGRDQNFISTLADAEALVAQAAGKDGRGLYELEEALGVPSGQWVKQCAPSYAIWRYVVHKPDVLGLRMASGAESGAFESWVDKAGEHHKGQWAAGGKTEGGKAEAVIEKISLKDLEALGTDVLEKIQDASMAENTRRVFDQTKG
jgi:hypothetical protein